MLLINYWPLIIEKFGEKGTVEFSSTGLYLFTLSSKKILSIFDLWMNLCSNSSLVGHITFWEALKSLIPPATASSHPGASILAEDSLA